MYSAPIEGMLMSLNVMKKVLTKTILRLNNKVSYRIKNTMHIHGCFLGVYNHWVALGNTSPSYSEEDIVGFDYTVLVTKTYTTAVETSYKAFQSFYLKAKAIEKTMFMNKRLVNNTIGSPWTEFEDLNTLMLNLKTFAVKYSSIKYLNENRALLTILQLILSHVIDCKWALISYHDILSRGFEKVFNGEKEYIKWEFETFKGISGNLSNFSDSIEKIGNISSLGNSVVGNISSLGNSVANNALGKVTTTINNITGLSTAVNTVNGLTDRLGELAGLPNGVGSLASIGNSLTSNLTSFTSKIPNITNLSNVVNSVKGSNLPQLNLLDLAKSTASNAINSIKK